MGSLSLLQGIFPTQGSNPCLPHCRLILYQLSHKGSPRLLEWVAYPFSRRSSQPRNQTRVSCIAGGFFTSYLVKILPWAIREAQHPGMHSQMGFRKHHYEQASGGDGISVELFQILKDDAVKVLHSTCQQIWKTQQWPQDWKRSVFIPISKKGNAKVYSNYLKNYAHFTS